MLPEMLAVTAPVVRDAILLSSATVGAVPVIVIATSPSCVVELVSPLEAVPPGARFAAVSDMPPLNTIALLVAASKRLN